MGLARMLKDKGLVDIPGKLVSGTVRVTLEGYEAVDRLKELQAEKRTLGFQLS